MHHCQDSQYPFLGFHYTEEQKLTCTCSSLPHYGSPHIAKDKCAGHRCEKPDHPVLDWDEEQEECVCRSHPCWNDRGEKHECKQPNHPVLRYREEEDDENEMRPVCECFMKLSKEPPTRGGQVPLTEFAPGGGEEEEFVAPEYYDEDEF